MRSNEIEGQRRAKATPGRTTVLVVVLLFVLMVLAFLLRVWHLNAIPPWLFSDEAAYGLDVREVIQGEFRVFFPRNLGREPLFNYLAVPFVALWDGTPVAIRLPSAIMGVLMVPALFLAGKALWRDRPGMGDWAGLAAASFWVVNYWPQSVNRMAFHVNTLPLILTLAVIAWLSWTARPTRGRALIFGFLAGLSLATYLAARITPLLWLLLYVALPLERRESLRPSLVWAFLAYLLATAPLGIHFVLHPGDFLTRMTWFEDQETATSLVEYSRMLLASAVEVAGVFLGGAGDPLPRHNLPGRPPFPLALAILFAVGFLSAIWNLRRRVQRSWTLLLWLTVMSLPSVLAANVNPHFLRLLGALPAAFLVAAWPVASFAEWSNRRGPILGAVGACLMVLVVGVEGVRTARDYFVTWAKETDLYVWYEGDVWQLGELVAQAPAAVGVVPLSPGFPPPYHEYTLEYAFKDSTFLLMQVDEDDIETWLDDHLGSSGGTRIFVPIWHEGMHLDADPKGIIPFYLAREGSQLMPEQLRGFDLLSFSLGETPQFREPGQSEEPHRQFSSDVVLVDARWGVGYPNPDRDGGIAAAGTEIWAILTWQLEHPRTDLKVSLDLVDAAGHRLDSDEVPLLDTKGLPVSVWPAGSMARSYHLATVPRSQPPGEIMLESRVYEADTLVPLPAETGTVRGSAGLASASIAPAQEPLTAESLTLAHRLEAVVSPGIELLGIDPWTSKIAPGQVLSLRVFWQVDVPPSSTQTYTVSLVTTGVSSAIHLGPELDGGRVVHTYVDLHLPPDLPAGTYRLVLTSAPGGPSVNLGQIDVAGRSHSFDTPSINMPLAASFGDLVALVGTDLVSDMPLDPGQTLEVALVWKVMELPAKDLVRFVHIVGPDGRPVAQEDSIPCAGGCPASSWLGDEVLVDAATLELPVDLVPGSYSIALGWYDAMTFERLSAKDAGGLRQAEDLLLLPVRLEVSPQ